MFIESINLSANIIDNDNLELIEIKLSMLL